MTTPTSDSDVERFLAVLGKFERDRRSLVVDDRYTTLCAFIGGYEDGVGIELLDGLNLWMSLRTNGRLSPIHWTGLILENVIPDVEQRRGRLFDLTPAEDAAACTALFRTLREFLRQRSPSGPDGARRQWRRCCPTCLVASIVPAVRKSDRFRWFWRCLRVAPRAMWLGRG